MNEWELTDEEIYDAANPNILPHYKRVWQDLGCEVCFEDRAIATAAQRKLVEWLASEEQKPLGVCSPVQIPYASWRSLRAALSPHEEAGK